MRYIIFIMLSYSKYTYTHKKKKVQKRKKKQLTTNNMCVDYQLIP